MNAERARELLDYNPETGALTWRVRASRRAKPGDVAGSINGTGYRYVEIGGKSYKASRLAWLITTGSWPVEVIDHVNAIRDDDRWINLREVTSSQNSENRGRARIVAKSGMLGVHEDRGRFRSSIRVRGKLLNLGTFERAEDAAAAYVAAKRDLHTGCTI